MQFVIAGLGGQGILFSSRLLGDVALKKGMHVMGSEVHGMAQRGGSVISFFKIGNYSSPMVASGHADVLIAYDQNEAIRNLPYLKKGGDALVNVHDDSTFENQLLEQYISERDIKLNKLYGYKILNENMGGRFLFLNVLLMGAMSGYKLGGISYEEVKETVIRLAPPKHLNDNLKVLELGYKTAL